MTQGHTPGPWEVVHQFNVTAGRRMIASTATISGNIQTGDALLAENEANARLIAAAPEMYEALKAFMSFYDKAMEGASPGFDEARGGDHVLFGMNDARLMIGHFWDARGAIAKAEGRT